MRSLLGGCLPARAALRAVRWSILLSSARSFNQADDPGLRTSPRRWTASFVAEKYHRQMLRFDLCVVVTLFLKRQQTFMILKVGVMSRVPVMMSVTLVKFAISLEKIVLAWGLVGANIYHNLFVKWFLFYAMLWLFIQVWFQLMKWIDIPTYRDASFPTLYCAPTTYWNGKWQTLLWHIFWYTYKINETYRQDGGVQRLFSRHSESSCVPADGVHVAVLPAFSPTGWSWGWDHQPLGCVEP